MTPVTGSDGLERGRRALCGGGSCVNDVDDGIPYTIRFTETFLFVRVFSPLSGHCSRGVDVTKSRPRSLL